jgi:hypothetical protein
LSFLACPGRIFIFAIRLNNLGRSRVDHHSQGTYGMITAGLLCIAVDGR